MSEQNSSTPNWPIRVGGQYAFKNDRPAVSGRVAATDGDRIHWVHRYSHNGEEFAANDDDSEMFRALFRPEDQSPIPALVAVLKAIQFKGHNQVCPICKGTENSGHGLMCDIGVALALAGEPTEDSNAE